MLFWKKDKTSVLKDELCQSVKKCLGYRFKKKDLLLKALTHASAREENQGTQKTITVPHFNERLEFLGDAVLGLVISEILYQKYHHMNEGKMSVIKSNLVSREVLGKKCSEIGLDKLIIVGKGIKDQVLPVSVLANAMEAVFGAIFIESDYKSIEKVISRIFEHDVNISEHTAKYSNYKATLQDYSQQNFARVPFYKVTKQSGPKHKPVFEVMVHLPGKLQPQIKQGFGPGIGNDKKSAEQAAAKIALDELKLLP